LWPSFRNHTWVAMAYNILIVLTVFGKAKTDNNILIKDEYVRRIRSRSVAKIMYRFQLVWGRLRQSLAFLSSLHKLISWLLC
jgi:hypothetical protein